MRKAKATIKRALAAILCAGMVMSCIPTAVFATDTGPSTGTAVEDVETQNSNGTSEVSSLTQTPETAQGEESQAALSSEAQAFIDMVGTLDSEEILRVSNQWGLANKAWLKNTNDDVLFDIIPFPDLSALTANFNDSEITLSYLSNRPHWAEMMAERWLKENKEECLSRIAVHKQVEKLVQCWKADSKSKAYIYKSMKEAADKCDGFLIVDCSARGEPVRSFRVQSVVFGNQYGSDYDMIPYLEKITENSHLSRRAQGYIFKEDIAVIRDRTGNKVIWRKNDDEGRH